MEKILLDGTAECLDAVDKMLGKIKTKTAYGTSYESRVSINYASETPVYVIDGIFKVPFGVYLSKDMDKLYINDIELK